MVNSRDWRAAVWRRLGRLPLLKGVGTTGGMTLFFVLYFWLLEHPQYPVREMPLTAVDRWVPFAPLALFPYISLWVYISLVPALLTAVRTLVQFAVVAAGLSLAGYVCFYFWPTSVPVLAVDWSAYPGMGFLKSVDAAGNACPSLHVAFAVLSGMALDHLWQRSGGGALGRGGLALWGLAIVYSTLGTKQHVFYDALGGAVLGLLAGWVLLWWWRREGVGA